MRSSTIAKILCLFWTIAACESAPEIVGRSKAAKDKSDSTDSSSTSEEIAEKQTTGGIDEQGATNDQTPQVEEQSESAPKVWKEVDRKEVTAAHAAGSFSFSYSVPLGWGYMDPMIAMVGEDVYTPTFFPLNLGGNKKFYNVQILKNGVAFGPLLSLAYAFAPSGYSTSEAYQPPMVFVSGTKLILAYWLYAVNTSYYSFIHLVSMDTAAATPAWSLLARYTAPSGHIFNYIGGGMGPNGEIYIAGYDTASSGAANQLRVIRAVPPTYGTWATQSVASFSSKNFNPLYPHVAVDKDGDLSILTVLSNMTPCATTGGSYTNYKNVVLYRGTFGSPMTKVFEDASQDVTTNPSTNGNPCTPYNMRFPSDLLYDKDIDRVFSVVRINDVKAGGSGLAACDAPQKIRIYEEGKIVVDDVLAHAKPRFENAGCYSKTASLTKINGTYVIAIDTSQDDENQDVTLLMTKDFKTFDPPISIDTPFGVGNSVKLNQPDKNGSEVGDKLHLWFGGELTGPVNKFLEFTLVTLGLE